ncbi:unnamed protein product [Rotaria socialis]|uniref:Uncharacterized protein n=1 Tax=Rotaria socialis TaxID=392032 RepID=A0A818X4E8_9BILA|nr:unnamed protein product [Rotaria socialis]
MKHVKMAINEYVFKPLSQYLLKKEINSVFTLCSSNEDGVIGQPDFAFFHNDIVKLVIEVKTIWSLTAPDNLAADYRISGPQVRLPVEQIFGYIPGDQKTSKKTSLFSRQVGHPV